MTGGAALVATLAAHGVDTVFCVPGESYLAVLEALRRRADTIRLVTARHEAGAAFAANGFAKIGRRPGIAFVSRGPGAANASIAVHTADQDSVPLVLCIGQVPRRELGREGFQEIDYAGFFGTVAKAVLQPGEPSQVARVTAEALALARSGRPGPVVVVLPEDVTGGDAGGTEIPGPRPLLAAEPSPALLRRAAALIDGARRPLIVAGEIVKAEAATMRLAAFAETAAIPVTTAFRCQDAINNEHPAYAGAFALPRAPHLIEAWRASDLLILAGSRFDAVTSADFALREQGKPTLMLHPCADTIAALAPLLGLATPVGPALLALTGAVEPPSEARAAWLAELRGGQERFRAEAQPASGRVDMAELVRHVDRRLATMDHVVTNDAGNFSTWLHRHFRWRLPDSQAGPMSGAMGYAVPAAVGAALARPRARVVAFVGDGGFMMTGQELATAVRNELPLIVIVCDNGHYGTIVMHQHALGGPDRVYGTALGGPDFAALGRAYGARGRRVETTEDFAAAFDAALAEDEPSLLHVVTDIRDISATRSLAEVDAAR